MELKLFSDLIDVLGKVVSGLKSLANLPKAERDKFRQVLDETYRLIDTALNMVIIRLGDALLEEEAAKFVEGVKRFDNLMDWYNEERELRLCHSLRVAVREAETLTGRLPAALSVRDWERLLKMMKQLLATEGELAGFISKCFGELAAAARGATSSAAALRGEVEAFRSALVKERQRLIEQEVLLYEVV